MKIGIIGCGQAGTAHAAAYKRIEEFDLVAVCDIDNEKTEVFNKYYTAVPMGLDELISKVDIVDICVPTNSHLEIIKQAARQGKDIICETPIAATLEDAFEIVKLCSENNIRLLPVHFQGMSGPLHKVRNMYLNNELDNRGMIRISRRRPLLDEADWRYSLAEGGGVILELLIQDIAFLMKNLGFAVRVYAKTTYGQIDFSGEYALLSISFANGAIAHLDGSWTQMDRAKDEFEFANCDSLVEFSEDKHSPIAISLKTDKGNHNFKESPTNEDMYYVGFSENIKAFKDGEGFTTTLEDSIRILEVALSAIKSAQTGNVVELD